MTDQPKARTTTARRHKSRTLLASAAAALCCGMVSTAMIDYSPGRSVENAESLALIEITTSQLDQLEDAVFTAVPHHVQAQNIEISLVLDISPAQADPAKLARIQALATAFVDSTLTEPPGDRVSVSLVPYAGHVNLGRDLFSALGVSRQRHGFSYCIELPRDAFDMTGVPQEEGLQQVQHVNWGDSGLLSAEQPVCPRNDTEEVVAFSQNRAQLHARIGALSPRSQAALYQGIKWGVALLDPSMRPAVYRMAQRGNVDGAFARRPASFTDRSTRKALVVISGGRNGDSLRVADWAYNSPSEYVHWSRFPVRAYLEKYVREEDRDEYFFVKYSGSEGDRLTLASCAAAKQAGIVVWTIGVDADAHGAELLRACATSPDHALTINDAGNTDLVAEVAERMIVTAAAKTD